MFRVMPYSSSSQDKYKIVAASNDASTHTDLWEVETQSHAFLNSDLNGKLHAPIVLSRQHSVQHSCNSNGPPSWSPCRRRRLLPLPGIKLGRPLRSPVTTLTELYRPLGTNTVIITCLSETALIFFPTMMIKLRNCTRPEQLLNYKE